MIASLLKERRAHLGISQVKLSALSGVSLPTIQNIELNKANPSYSTLEALCLALRLQVSISPQTSDLELLISAGLPLEATVSSRSGPSSERLREELVKLCLLLQTPSPETERLREVTQAFLLAISSQFPTWFRTHLFPIPAVRNLLPTSPSGRHVKLARQARERLATVL